MKSNLILANPLSARGKGARVLANTMRYLDNQKIRYQIIAASSLAKTLEEFSAKSLINYERVLVIGGDGMIHHSINALAQRKEIDHLEVPVGIIPAGTGNDFARALGLHLNHPERNLDHYLSTEPRSVDLGEIDGVRFGAICSTGFDSIVNERANQMSWPRGKRKYDFAMIQELPRFKPRHYRITIDGQTSEVLAMLIAIANGPSYGGGMKVCPDAQLNDGLLDVMVLKPVPKGEFLRIFPKVYQGKHVSHPQVEISRGRTIHIEGEAITYADGERIGPTPVQVKVLPGALRTWAFHE
jgi:diacylglycerol kinase (ATP)